MKDVVCRLHENNFFEIDTKPKSETEKIDRATLRGDTIETCEKMQPDFSKHYARIKNITT